MTSSSSNSSSRSSLRGSSAKSSRGFLLGDDLPLEGVVELHDPRHEFLDGLQLFGREGLGHLEVVVETVVDGGTEPDPGTGDQFAHRGGEDVRRGVAQHAQGLRVALGEEAYGRPVAERPVQIDDLVVHDRGQRGASESGADLGCEGCRTRAAGQRQGAAVGQGDVDGFVLHGA